MIHLYLEKRKVESHNSEPERIVVHVNKDGTYKKTVERVGASNGGSGSSVPVNNRGTRKR
mgnify:CR=1 FL=1